MAGVVSAGDVCAVKALSIGLAFMGWCAHVVVVEGTCYAMTESGGKLLSTAPDDVSSEDVAGVVTSGNPHLLG